MTPADIPAGLRLCRAAGWNQLESDWRFFLEFQTSSVAEINGEVVGTVATLPWGWIAMVLVDPAHRHRGIGTLLLKESLRLLSDIETVRLDASPAGKPIYDKFGFVEEYSLTRLKSPSPAVAHALMRAASRLVSTPDPSPLTPIDLPRILALDRSIFGADRSPLLRHLHARAPEYAFVSEGAYSFARPGHTATHLGPVVAPDPTTAQSLISAAIAVNPTRPYLMDVPDSAPLLQNWLCSSNFAPERPFIRMYRGPKPSGNPAHQYAIAGPEFG